MPWSACSRSSSRPEFWIARESNAKKIVLDSQAIAAQNARLLQLDPSVHDLEKFPSALTAADVRSWIEKLSQYPDEDMFDAAGRKLERSDFDALMNNIALESVPESSAHALRSRREARGPAHLSHADARIQTPRTTGTSIASRKARCFPARPW